MQSNCETCGKVFATNQNFKKHLRTHTGEKPFTCDVCGKSISDPSYLLAHKRKHLTDENGDALYMYNCHLCEKGFNRKGYLRTHLYNHKLFTLPRQDSVDLDENQKCDMEIGNKREVEKKAEVEKNPWMMTYLQVFLSGKKLKDKKGSEFDSFPCSLCPKFFSRICNLKAHLQAHEEGSLKDKEKVSKKKIRSKRIRTLHNFEINEGDDEKEPREFVNETTMDETEKEREDSTD